MRTKRFKLRLAQYQKLALAVTGVDLKEIRDRETV